MLGVHFGHLHKPFPPRQPLALAIVKCYLIVIFFLRDGGRGYKDKSIEACMCLQFIKKDKMNVFKT